MPNNKSKVNLNECLEEQGRFLAFIRNKSPFFLTKAVSKFYHELMSGSEEGWQFPADDEDGSVVMRLRAYPTGSKLPDLFEGDVFTVNGKDYRILQLLWGYKPWAKRQVKSADFTRTGPRSDADTVAFVVCEASKP